MFKFNQVLTQESANELGFVLMFQWTSTMGGHLAIVDRDNLIVARGLQRGTISKEIMIKVVY